MENVIFKNGNDIRPKFKRIGNNHKRHSLDDNVIHDRKRRGNEHGKAHRFDIADTEHERIPKQCRKIDNIGRFCCTQNAEIDDKIRQNGQSGKQKGKRN